MTNFKVNATPGLGAGHFSIERIQDKIDCVVFRNGAKVILHSSYILKKLSKVDFMKKEKKDALYMETAVYENGKPVRTVCKVQFHDEKTADEVKKLFDTLI